MMHVSARGMCVCVCVNVLFPLHVCCQDEQHEEAYHKYVLGLQGLMKAAIVHS